MTVSKYANFLVANEHQTLKTTMCNTFFKFNRNGRTISGEITKTTFYKKERTFERNIVESCICVLVTSSGSDIFVF